MNFKRIVQIVCQLTARVYEYRKNKQNISKELKMCGSIWWIAQ